VSDAVQFKKELTTEDIASLRCWDGGTDPPWAEYIQRDLWPLVVPISAVMVDPANLREHNEQNLSIIASSLRQFGQRKPVVANAMAGGCLEAGNGTWAAASQMLRWEYIAALFVADDPTTALRYQIVDNRSSDTSEFMYGQLAEALSQLQSQDEALLDGTGFTADEVAELVELHLEDGEEKEAGTGELLELTEVTIEEPTSQVVPGDIWRLGERHVLLVVDVMAEWPLWKPWLEEADTIFVPYPGPFVPLTMKAEECKLVLVQPDAFTAGHMVDRYREIHGQESAKKLQVVEVTVG
jgi:hypothetical protein